MIRCSTAWNKTFAGLCGTAAMAAVTGDFKHNPRWFFLSRVAPRHVAESSVGWSYVFEQSRSPVVS